MEFTLFPITVTVLTDAIAAAALALPCDPLEVQPVHVQGLQLDLSFQGFLVVECDHGSLMVIIMVPSRSK